MTCIFFENVSFILLVNSTEECKVETQCCHESTKQVDGVKVFTKHVLWNVTILTFISEDY